MLNQLKRCLAVCVLLFGSLYAQDNPGNAAKAEFDQGKAASQKPDYAAAAAAFRRAIELDLDLLWICGENRCCRLKIIAIGQQMHCARSAYEQSRSTIA